MPEKVALKKIVSKPTCELVDTPQRNEATGRDAYIIVVALLTTTAELLTQMGLRDLALRDNRPYHEWQWMTEATHTQQTVRCEYLLRSV
jgi:hypothetical protein